MSAYDPLSFSIPLPLSIHSMAQSFCQPQWSPRKLKQVYLNTLAVYAVNTYLKYLGVETQLEHGDSWDPLMQGLTDTADLVVVNSTQNGRIECRPVLSNESMCHVPPEVWTGRMGYVAVELDDALRYAKLRGFLSEVNEMDIPLGQWRSLDRLLNTLSNVAMAEKTAISHLTEWLKGNFEPGWEHLTELALPQNLRVQAQPILQFRKPTGKPIAPPSTLQATVRGKPLDWQFPNGHQENLVLVVGIMPAQKTDTDIWVKLCPTQASTHLPANLDVVILDDQNTEVMQAHARQPEMIQFTFGGQIGEAFKIKISLDNVSKVESFMI